MARIQPFACCREALVGYRLHDANMSMNHARAARSNLKALDLVEAEATEVPAWVFAQGRARVLGYSAHLLSEGRIAAAARLFAALVKDQSGPTLAMCAALAQDILTGGRTKRAAADPAVGQSFLDADPATAPWQQPMLLTRRLKAMLLAADKTIRLDMPGR
ncbi:hypothetical protein N9C96_00885 [bacterium]|nr:hypothetical protein [bacterium]